MRDARLDTVQPETSVGSTRPPTPLVSWGGAKSPSGTTRVDSGSPAFVDEVKGSQVCTADPPGVQGRVSGAWPS